MKVESVKLNREENIRMKNVVLVVVKEDGKVEEIERRKERKDVHNKTKEIIKRKIKLKKWFLQGRIRNRKKREDEERRWNEWVMKN